ncbi:Tripartite motif-containing 2, putative [Babesia ovata]|uniref:Tripartite motif-containing 2, putative n=1 Tax=Babesia ovata TaxID=189622 RepID=A0A2H6KF25_9APIC|nr:Tripartite motif-containing 2, putative [Babesia ovata]GBE61559.1 Tripartite motif-containing 2, putative [Babesia ovata]
MRLDGLMLQRLPTDWQQKIHREFQTKLQLCIANPEEVRKTADFTWQTLLHGVEDRDKLAQRFGPHLGQYAGDFADWVLDFVAQAIHHFQTTDSTVDAAAGFPKSSMRSTRPFTSAGVHRESDRMDTSAYLGPTVSIGSGASDDSFFNDVNPPSSSNAGRTVPPRVEPVRPEPRMVGGLPSMRRDVPPMDPPSNRLGPGPFGYDPRAESFGPSSGSSRSGTVHAPSMVSRSGSFRSPTHMATPEPRMHDPLDETLDNLIMKQRMDRLHGRAGAPLGVLTRSSKFSPVEGDSNSRGSPLSPPYDHPNGYVRSPSMRGMPSDDYNYSPGAAPARIPKTLEVPRAVRGSLLGRGSACSRVGALGSPFCDLSGSFLIIFAVDGTPDEPR